MLKFPGAGATLPQAIARGGHSIRKGHDHENDQHHVRRAGKHAENIRELQKVAWGDVRDSFEKFCLTCGIEVLQGMMKVNVAELAGERHERAPDKPGYRWGSTVSQLDFHGGNVPLERPRVRDKNAGKEILLTTWEHFSNGEKLREWAANLMVMSVATRKFAACA